jgi:lysylphosphatidylglycerol synthetase-like protein (DUF2156 family)
MRRLIVAGLVYLTGIAVILLLKPALMFHDDGRWKEFGIGRDPTYFTYIPFWLFTIIWSIIAYLIVMLLEDSLYMPSDSIELPRNNIRTRNVKQAAAVEELTPGYYMLNEGSTGRNGVPRYVYLGPASGMDLEE